MGLGGLQIFSPLGDFSFCPLNSIFQRTEVLGFNEAQFINFFSFTGCGFSIVSSKSLPDSIHKDFFSYFFLAFYRFRFQS